MDTNFEDSLYDYLHILEGRRYALTLSKDQIARAMLVKVKDEPCIFCAGEQGKPDVIGHVMLPPGLQHKGFTALYTVCKPCFAQGDVQNRAKAAILDSQEGVS